jgi:hypothetical protein
MKAALILAGALIPGPIPAYEVEGNSIVFTEAEIRACVDEGGCRLITRAWLQERLKEAMQACKGNI